MNHELDHISPLITQLRQQGPVILLESQLKEHPASHSSLIAAQPKAILKAYGNEIHRYDGHKKRVFQQNPWEALSDFRREYGDWVFGYLGYDLKNHDEPLSSENSALNDTADMFFMIPELVIEVDVEQNFIPLKGKLPKFDPNKSTGKKIALKMQSKIPEATYRKMIERIKQDIYEGEYYELNLTHALQFEMQGDSWDLYQRMKKSGPVPFGGYADLQEVEICCASPERFLARKGNRVWSQPIKGTAARKRGSNMKEEIEQLKNSAKERAENLMIVDLVRNDFSRVATKASVQVSKLFEIQSFETVHQMVSTVECKVAETTDSLEVIKACFPMGSMTGAPKISAMQAIERYEHYRRGIYSGALGYIKPNGDFDFNVIIRTAIIQNQNLVYPVGGAITSDSNAKDEWEETLIKAQAITNIVKDLEKPE